MPELSLSIAEWRECDVCEGTGIGGLSIKTNDQPVGIQETRGALRVCAECFGFGKIPAYCDQCAHTGLESIIGPNGNEIGKRLCHGCLGGTQKPRKYGVEAK